MQSMHHNTTRELISFLDGDAAAADRLRIDAHLAECAACRAELALQRAMAAAIQSHGRTEPPFDFTARVMEQIIPARHKSFARELFHNAPAWMMAACLAAALLVLAFRQSSGGVTPANTLPHEITASGNHATHAMTEIILNTSHTLVAELTLAWLLPLVALAVIAMLEMRSRRLHFTTKG